MIFISSKSGQKTYFESYLNIFRVDFYVSALDMRKWNSIHDLISKAETFADWINGQSTNILTGKKLHWQIIESELTRSTTNIVFE